MGRDRELTGSSELNELGDLNKVGDVGDSTDTSDLIDSIGSNELSESITKADVDGLINVLESIKSIREADEIKSEGLVEDRELIDLVDVSEGDKEAVSGQGNDRESGSLRKLVSKRRKFLVGVLGVFLLVMLGSVIYELSFDRGYELSVEGVQELYGDYLVDMNDDLLEGENLANLMDTYFSEQLRADVDLETSRASFEETIGKGMRFNGEVTGTKIVEDPEGNVIRIEVSVREWLAESGEEVLPDEKGIGVYTFIEEEGRVVISEMVDYTNATEVDEDGKIKE